jgi:N-acetylmuramoyl-L-alanine amidase
MGDTTGIHNNVIIPYSLEFKKDTLNVATKDSTNVHLSKPKSNRFKNAVPWCILRPDIQKKLPLYDAVIMINPGHGEKLKNGKTAKGTHGKVNGKPVWEKDINDKIAENARRKLERLGATVLYVDNTPVPDIQLAKNTKHPDVFCSFHVDAPDEAGKFTKGETVYTNGKEGKKLAGYVNTNLKNDSRIPNNGINSIWGSHLMVLKGDTTVAGILVEGGFLTNKREAKLLSSQDYQNFIAQATVDGIRRYINAQKAAHKPKKSEARLLYEKLTSPIPATFKIEQGYDK